jgi:hypothetical protein
MAWRGTKKRKRENEEQHLVSPQFLGYDLSSFVLTPERESPREGRTRSVTTTFVSISGSMLPHSFNGFEQQWKTRGVKSKLQTYPKTRFPTSPTRQTLPLQDEAKTAPKLKILLFVSCGLSFPPPALRYAFLAQREQGRSRRCSFGRSSSLADSGHGVRFPNQKGHICQ